LNAFVQEILAYIDDGNGDKRRVIHCARCFPILKLSLLTAFHLQREPFGVAFDLAGSSPKVPQETYFVQTEFLRANSCQRILFSNKPQAQQQRFDQGRS
jgi:hypothetical protein